eukprot:13839.XXX_173954_173162_1 [CDS] Oithona nana genome sequencing.
MKTSQCVLSMIGLFAVLVVAEENEDGTKSVVLTMDQSFDSGKSFSNRGSITIHSLRSGAVSIQQNDLTESEKDAIVSLCHDDGLYLIRAVSNGDTISSFRSATHACNLIETGLSDLFTIQLDWRHKIVAMHLSTPSHQSKVPMTNATGFKSRVVVQHMESGPSPDTASFVQKIEEEKLAKERGETKDNRSFFAKYWMYIIPFVLVLAMSGGGQEGGGGR